MPETKREPIWNRFLTERDRLVFGDAGYGTRAGFGQRPALLVIDVNYAFCGDRREPILESVKRWRNSCGEDAWDALPVLQTLIETAREQGVPVIYTTGIRRGDNWDNGSWSWKNNRTDEERRRGHQPRPQRDHAADRAGSARHRGAQAEAQRVFRHQSDELSDAARCDSLLVTGTTTSGCVRASVLDAFSNNIRCTVIEDGCFDRSRRAMPSTCAT